MHSLLTIPFEILEHIAYYVGSNQLSGPPTDLVSLSASCRVLHNSLAPSRNPTLYAAIFSYKFDTTAIKRRLDDEYVTPTALSLELSRRFTVLQRLRHGDGSQVVLSDSSYQENDLWQAILMMLENDGKNAVQLKEWGRISEWMKDFFLEYSGASRIAYDSDYNTWPRSTFQNCLALWLLYLCDNGGIIDSSLYVDIYRAFAVGANRYPVTPFTWTDFRHPCAFSPSEIHVTEYLGQTLHPRCPSVALPAILGHLAQLKEPTLWRLSSQALSKRTTFRKSSSAVQGSSQWDSDWARWKPIEYTSDTDSATRNVVQHFVFPNAFEGTWEGLFTYLDFGVFAAILAGEPPQIATDSTIGQNLHVWKLREYHLYGSSSDEVLPPGSPRDAFFPSSATIAESGGQLTISHDSQSFIYTRSKKDIFKDTVIRDMILIGEGHSAWGEFRLKGRIRARDGFITILKEYNGPDERGKWLYRGYLLGNNFVGRWRDTMTPTTMVGYEGGFELHKRS